MVIKLTICVSILTFISTVLIHSQDLPHKMTKEEASVWSNYNYPVNPLFTDPPISPVRGMAEWEELQGVIITWRTFYTILKDIVDYAQDEGTVYIICSDSNLVKDYLTNTGVPHYNIKYLIVPSNSVWVRDYGPWTAYSNSVDTINIIDWIYNRPRPLDDVTPEFFANYINVPIYQTTTNPYNLIHTGGNLFIDGHGTAFSSNLVLDENPTKSEAEIDTIMKKYLGIDRYVKLTNLPYDVIHHIDMHMKLLDEETLLVGEYPAGVSDGPQIEANLQYILQNYLTCFGRPFNIVRIPMPPDALGRYPNAGGDYRTYTNSVIINKTVIIPTYEYQYDTTAFRIYKEAMPGYNIVGINSNSIIPSLGAIHCIVKEVGAFDPVFISHPKMLPSIVTPDSIKIQARLQTSSGISHAFVYWTADTTIGFTPIQMEYTSGDTFFTHIPPQINGTEIYYYISATSNNGKTITKPFPAPEGFYRFIVNNNITMVVDANILKHYYLSQNYPNPFNPVTTISYSLPLKSQVELVIYNALGERVIRLVNGEKEAGKYSVEFDGNSLPSGIYFYRLQAGSYRETKKMILLR